MSDAKYPWDRWLNGEQWVLTPGKDFTIKRDDMRTYAREVANRLGFKVRVSVAGPKRLGRLLVVTYSPPYSVKPDICWETANGYDDEWTAAAPTYAIPVPSTRTTGESSKAKCACGHWFSTADIQLVQTIASCAPDSRTWQRVIAMMQAHSETEGGR